MYIETVQYALTFMVPPLVRPSDRRAGAPERFVVQSPQQVIARLKEGNARFVSDTPLGPARDRARRAATTTGQSPYAVVLSCADSRVVPELVFDTGIGELFVVRVAGNIANTSTIASIEYAVANLGTSVVVVMGHQACGAVTAALGGGDSGYNLNHLLTHILPAKHAAGERGDDVEVVVKKNAELTAEALASRSEILKRAIDAGQLRILPAYYELETGRVLLGEDAVCH